MRNLSATPVIIVQRLLSKSKRKWLSPCRATEPWDREAAHRDHLQGGL